MSHPTPDRHRPELEWLRTLISEAVQEICDNEHDPVAKARAAGLAYAYRTVHAKLHLDSTRHMEEEKPLKEPPVSTTRRERRGVPMTFAGVDMTYYTASIQVGLDGVPELYGKTKITRSEWLELDSPGNRQIPGLNVRTQHLDAKTIGCRVCFGRNFTVYQNLTTRRLFAAWGVAAQESPCPESTQKP